MEWRKTYLGKSFLLVTRSNDFSDILPTRKIHQRFSIKNCFPKNRIRENISSREAWEIPIRMQNESIDDVVTTNIASRWLS